VQLCSHTHTHAVYFQGHDGHGALTALPSTCAFVDVYFHRTPPTQLAPRSPVVAALLAAKPRITKGAHRVPMARLVAAANMSSSAVRVCARVCVLLAQFLIVCPLG